MNGNTQLLVLVSEDGGDDAKMYFTDDVYFSKSGRSFERVLDGIDLTYEDGEDGGGA
jgi:hypothetical protein